MDRACSSAMCVEMEGISCGAAEGWREVLTLGCGVGARVTLDRLR